MTVGISGTGPAAESVGQVLADAGIDTPAIESGEVGTVDLAVVVGDVGAPAFDGANEAAFSATGSDAEWIAVELGGIGGRPLETVDAAVCGFGPEAGCFDCLRARVAANVGTDRGERSEANAGTGESAASPGIDSATARLAGTIAGRKTLQTVAGASVGGLIELPHAEREVLPVPGCRCGDGSDRSDGSTGGDRGDSNGGPDGDGEGGENGSRFGRPVRRDERRSMDEAVARAERTLDPRIGIVDEIGEAASFPVPYYLASLGDTTPFSDGRATPRAAGVAADWNAAFMKAIGEAIERYCAGVYRTAELPEARPSDLDRAVSPAEFVLPTDDRSEDTDEPIRWVPGEALVTGSPVRLPASFVLFAPPTERFRPAITTGLGLGNSGAEALLSGLYEVIERDATMCGWYSTFEPLGLDVDSAGFETLRRRARAEELATTALLMTQDVDVPVVTAAVHRENEWPRFAVGSGADLDAARAAESALAEALQNWTEVRGMGRENASGADGAIGHYAAFPPIAQTFVDVDRTIPAATIGSEEVSGTDELAAVLDRLADIDLDAYGARLTTRDVAEVGFEAVRVLVPSAQPLFTGEPFFGKRARTVPASLGFEPRLDREPHPYP